MVRIMDGSRKQLSSAQLEDIEAAYGVKLPEELREYIKHHPTQVVAGNLTWGSSPLDIVNLQQSFFRNKLKFDLENNDDYWPTVLGERPADMEARITKATEYMEQLPPLIPVRDLKYYVPTTISDVNMRLPIISFHQFVDTIFMYKNLSAFEKKKHLPDGVKLDTLPGVSGWDKIIDGLGASDEELYIKEKI